MTRKLMLQDLNNSGLSESDCKKLKITAQTATTTFKQVKKKLSSYRLPYFDINGKSTGFYRVRFLEAPKGFQGKKKKQQRYSQPADSGNHLYFPPLVPWKEIAKDSTVSIFITEGEKKAAKACKEGLSTVGLGGVWSFRSKKEKKLLIADFNSIKWDGRETYLVFDSDLKNNSKVLKALYVLAEELSLLGASVFIIFLPDGEDGSKIGLDDYLLSNDAETIYDLEYEEYEMSREMWKLNNEVCYVSSPSSIYHFETGQILSKDNFTGLMFANRNIVVEVDNKMKKLNAAVEWLKWPLRRTHAGLSYSPGDPEILDNGKINIWKGWGVEPKRGSLKIWKEFMDYFFQDDKEKFREWFTKWLAYPLQYPGTKMYTSVVFHGLMQGTGKSFMGIIMSNIYGENYNMVTEEDIYGSHNGWALNNQFIMGEEITGTDKRAVNNKIKNMITREMFVVNDKYVPHYKIEDRINWLFNSQYPDAFLVEKHDRRYAIYEAPNVCWEQSKYDELDEWCRSDDVGALFYHLLRVDVKGFNPRAHAPYTTAKANMQLLSLSDLDSYADTLVDQPDSILIYGGRPVDRDLFTTEELIRIYDPESERRTTSIAMSKALRRAGYTQLPPTTTKNGTKRLWAIRNPVKWGKTGHAERSAEYEGNVVFMDEVKKRDKFKAKGGKK